MPILSQPFAMNYVTADWAWCRCSALTFPPGCLGIGWRVAHICEQATGRWEMRSALPQKSSHRRHVLPFSGMTSTTIMSKLPLESSSSGNGWQQQSCALCRWRHPTNRNQYPWCILCSPRVITCSHRGRTERQYRSGKAHGSLVCSKIEDPSRW